MRILNRVRASRATMVLGWVAVVAVAVWTVVRLAGLESGYPGVALTAFTPYVIPLALIAAALLVVLGQRLQAVASALCAVALFAVVAPRAIPNGPPDPRPEGPELRVIGINLLVGSADLTELDSLARDYDADLIVLSELTPDATSEIRSSPLGRRFPHMVLDPHVGSAGTGLISRLPLRQLPAEGHGNDLPTVIADAAVPGAGQVEVYAIHPYPPLEGAAAAQIGRYLDAIPAAPEDGPPRILIGDFNSTLDDSRLRDLLDEGYTDAADARGAGLMPTWPRRLFPPAPVTIDHVVADDRVEVLDFDTAEIHGTDHWAITSTLRLPARETR
jgi:endonuclease/exonuclease/phosphatase (EEP) superfamily protein YafD